MKMLKRTGLFILTNLLVVITLGIVINLVSHFLGYDLQAGGLSGLMVLCLIWGFGGAFISLLMSRWIAKTFHGVKVIDPQTMDTNERHLLNMVYQIARRAGMTTMPEVGYYESSDVNAFATGPSESRSLVAVSTGLMNAMNDAEVEGVLAHEIAHIVNGDMVTMTLIQGVVNAFAMFFAQIITMIVMNALRRNDDDGRRGFGDYFLRSAIYNIASIFLTLLGSILVNYFSRQREFRADAGGAQYSSREKMTAALQKLQRVHELPSGRMQDQEERDGKDTLAALKISSKPSGIGLLFMTHPPLAERIAALQNRSY
jgi:heat shock protein HtpX